VAAARRTARKSIKDAIHTRAIDSIEHSSLIDDEGIAPRQAGTARTWYSNIYNDDFIPARKARKAGMPFRNRSRRKRKIGRLQREEFSRHAFQSGAKNRFSARILACTRTADNAKQFAKMVEWGMKPIDANSSRHDSRPPICFGWSAKAGALEADHYADIIAVSGDPSPSDVRVLESVKVCDEGWALSSATILAQNKIGSVKSGCDPTRDVSRSF